MTRKTEQARREFVELLDRCKTQVEADPSGLTRNPHLHVALHRVYLRLCHGNIPDHAQEVDMETALPILTTLLDQAPETNSPPVLSLVRSEEKI